MNQISERPLTYDPFLEDDPNSDYDYVDYNLDYSDLSESDESVEVNVSDSFNITVGDTPSVGNPESIIDDDETMVSVSTLDIKEHFKFHHKPAAITIAEKDYTSTVNNCDDSFSEDYDFPLSGSDSYEDFGILYEKSNYQNERDAVEDKAALLQDEDKAALLQDEDKAALLQDEDKAALLQDEDKAALFQDEDKAALLQDEDKAALLQDEHKAALLQDEHKAALLQDEDKAALLQDEDKAALLQYGDEAAMFEDEDEAALFEDEDEAALLEDEDEAALLEDEYEASLLEDEYEASLLEDEDGASMLEDKAVSPDTNAIIDVVIDVNKKEFNSLQNSEIAGDVLSLTKDDFKDSIDYFDGKSVEFEETSAGVNAASFFAMPNPENVLVGYLTIKPKTVKPFERTQNLKILYTVLNGKLVVKSTDIEKVHGVVTFSKKEIREGNCIAIPPNHPYTLENRTNNVVKLQYIVLAFR